MQHHEAERDWATRAARVLPAAGFGNFDPSVVISRGKGARVWDDTGKEYIDYLMGSGPMLVGHAHPEVNAAVEKQLRDGVTFFATNPAGIELAEVICDAVPCAEQLRFVSTGSEADMYAMRLARAHTGRHKILKFEGGYHGMSGEGLMSLMPQCMENFPQPVPDSAGIPDTVRDGVLVGPFNDAEFAHGIIEEYKDDLAGVIVEPLQRLIPPVPGFLETLREETERHGIVLIFDEVVTGFRIAWGGGQELYRVTPDLCTLGKAIGGGFPLAAIVGSVDIMAHFDKAKVGDKNFTFQIGTLSGNPIAAVAGLKTLEILKRPGSYEQLRNTGRKIMSALDQHLSKTGTPFKLIGDPVLFDVFFTNQHVKDYRDVLTSNMTRLKQFNASLRAAGILKAESKFYVSLAHQAEEIDLTAHAIATAAEASPAAD